MPASFRPEAIEKRGDIVVSAGKSSAVAAVASDLGKGVAHSPPDGEDQAALFAALDDAADLYAASPIAPPKRGPGRPRGSLNTSTKQLKQWLAARGYRDPLEFLAALASGDAGEIARQMDVDPMEVLKLQVKAASELAAYVHQRAPISVDAPAASRPLIVIQAGAADPARAGDGAPVVLDLSPQYQGLSDSGAPISHAQASHEPGKGNENQ